MEQIHELLKGFNSLAEFRDFLNEQINDGSEISRGKDPNDISKEAKGQNPQAQDKEAEGGFPEEPPMEDQGGDFNQPAGQEPPPVDPSAAPGSQITIGNKVIKKEDDAKAVRIKVGGQPNKLNMRPQAKIKDGEVTPL